MTNLPGQFAGYASVFHRRDRQGDVVLPRSLHITNPLTVLWQHDPAQPIGHITRHKQDAHGLWVEGQLLLSLKQGFEAWQLLKHQVIAGLSIGFIPKQTSPMRAGGGRLIRAADVWEVSLVTFPANTAALVRLTSS